MTPPWAKLEEEAKSNLRRDARAELKVLQSTLGIVGSLLALPRSRGIGAITEAQVLLLSQLATGVRVVGLVVERGYAVQGLAQLANIYELAIAVGYVGRDAERARSWHEHTIEKKSFPSPRERSAAMRALVEAGGVDRSRIDAMVASWEQRYTHYCMAKHGNPLLLRRVGVRRSATRIDISLGAMTGGHYTDLARLVFFRAAHLLLMAALVFAKRETVDDSIVIPRALSRRFLNVAKSVAALVDDPTFARTV